jgi:hypothetical protein
MEVVEELNGLDTGPGDRPLEPPVIQGIELGE